LEVDASAFDIVAYAVAVLLRREPGCHPFTSIDAQSVSLNTLRVFVFALTPTIRYLKAFLEELVGLLLARARVLVAKVAVNRVKMRSTREEHMFSDLPPTSDIRRRGWHDRFVPQADIVILNYPLAMSGTRLPKCLRN
jgi:hypothetical protein